MADSKTVQKALTGSNAKVFLEGEEIATFQELTATVTIGYQDIQIGFDVDRKAVSWQGEGTLNWQSTNSLTTKLFDKIKAMPDVRFTIEAEMLQPLTGQTQAMTLTGVTVDALPLAQWAKGELVTNELSYRWVPSAAAFPQLID